MGGGVFARRPLSPGACACARIRVELRRHVLELVRQLHQRLSGVQIGTLVREPEAILRALMEHLRIHVVAPFVLTLMPQALRRSDGTRGGKTPL